MLVCRLGSDLFAYQDHCARCDASLRERPCRGGWAPPWARPCCAARAAGPTTTYVVPGACLDDAALHLIPVPLLTEGGITSLAVEVPVSV